MFTSITLQNRRIMGPVQKAPIIMEWVKSLYKKKRKITIGKFYSLDALYAIFVDEIGALTSMVGFRRIINKVANDTDFVYFKIRTKRIKNERRNDYIILDDRLSNIDINSIRRSNRNRNKRSCSVPASDGNANKKRIHTTSLSINTDTPTSSIPLNSTRQLITNDSKASSMAELDEGGDAAQSTPPTFIYIRTQVTPQQVTSPQQVTTSPQPVTINPQELTPQELTPQQLTPQQLTPNVYQYPAYNPTQYPVYQYPAYYPTQYPIHSSEYSSPNPFIPERSLHSSIISPFSIDAERYIKSTVGLDFAIFPRTNSIFSWMDEVEIRHEKTYSSKFYNVMLMTAYELGYKNIELRSDKLKLADAILCRESYLAGYSKPLITALTFHRLYFNKYENAKKCNPKNAIDALDSKRGCNRISYVDKLNETFPSFLHECYRHATRVCGLTETTKTLCTSMNTYAAENYPDCDIRSNLKMTKHHFWKFFYLHGGKLKRPITKPRLTKEHVQKRISFAQKWIQKLTENGIYVSFLDEKWFYTTSRRKKLKVLPRAHFETEEQAFVAKPKLRSRRFPIKVMFMGVICPPIDGKTKGKIYMKRVSEKVITKRQTYNQNFVTSYEMNHRLKGGEWKSLYVKNIGMTIDDFISVIQDTYAIDDDVAADLVFCYNSLSVPKNTAKEAKSKLVKLSQGTHGSILKNRTVRYISEDGSVHERPLKMNDLQLKVNPQKGRSIEKDITCDSSFMINNIRDIGSAIRKNYSFLPNDHTVYLFMDNAGGHGKTEIKAEYEKILKEEFNVQVEWQVPNSPETNMLDLGVWVSIQSLVERIHKGKVMRTDELSNSVLTAFQDFPCEVLTNIYNRWKLTFHLILSGKGTNEVVEEYRGSKKPLILENLPTVPDSECRKGYTYDYDDDNSDSTGSVLMGGDGVNATTDSGVMVELAFDNF